MKANPSFLAVFVDRFEKAPSDAWFRQTLAHRPTSWAQAGGANPTAPTLVEQLESIIGGVFVPTQDAIQLARAFYELAAGTAADRYQDPLTYVARCELPDPRADEMEELTWFDADTIPVIATDGLPGRGKTMLFRSLRAVLPGPLTTFTEGNPPQRITLRSALYLRFHTKFSLLDWSGKQLELFGIPKATINAHKSVSLRLKLLRRVLYRHGVVMLVLDELQFLSGLTGAKKAIDLLIDLRELGIPIVYFCNSDLSLNISSARSQLKQRIPTDRFTVPPILRGDSVWAEIISAKLAVLPRGSVINVPAEADNLYDLWAGSPRSARRTIAVGAVASTREGRPFTMTDLMAAWRSPTLQSFREEVAILTALSGVDTKDHPELSTWNSAARQRANFEQQLAANKLGAAAYLALQSQQSDHEAAVNDAFVIETFRATGKLPANVRGITEKGTNRRSTQSPEELLRNSMFTRKLSDINADKTPRK